MACRLIIRLTPMINDIINFRFLNFLLSNLAYGHKILYKLQTQQHPPRKKSIQIIISPSAFFKEVEITRIKNRRKKLGKEMIS